MIAYTTTIVRVLRAGTYHRMNGGPVKVITGSVVFAKKKLGEDASYAQIRANEPLKTYPW
jgi:hypothetical protein